ncbi:MAG: cytochrome c [Lentisphaeraceae bacterium]|nr:cytochrome c [Lentisphaeraceae bacterium]
MRLPMLLICLFYSTSLLGADKLSAAEEEGKKIYTLNCLACHALDQMIVGPSLVEIAHLHRKKPEGIVTWAMEPQQKRPGVIEMPPMSHLGKENLVKVASYILKVTEGKKYVKKKSGKDPFAQFPVSKIQRTFMPFVGPAAIAVSINNNMHLCWDAGTCQFRYAWKGEYLDNWPVLRGNGNGLAKVKGKIFNNINAGNPFKVEGKVKFHGYKKQDSLPVFMYSVGPLNVEAKVSSPDSNSVCVTYKVSGASGAVKFSPSVNSGKWSANKGKREGDSQVLSKQDLSEFTVTFAGDK